MFEIIDQITSSREIAEWIDPWAMRLEWATGQPAPQKGGVERIGWEVPREAWPVVASAVKRLILARVEIPAATAVVDGDEDWNRVIITLPSTQALCECFPANDKTNILTVQGLKRWAAVAITDNHVGMSVFASEMQTNDVIVRVQSIPADTVDLILRD